MFVKKIGAAFCPVACAKFIAQSQSNKNGFDFSYVSCNLSSFKQILLTKL